LLTDQERKKGFVVSQAPLIRFDLIRTSNEQFTFVMHFHHVLLDGWSVSRIFEEVRSSYLTMKQAGTPQLSTLPPFREYIAWLQKQDTKSTNCYWQERLAGFTEPTLLPIQQLNKLQPEYCKIRYSLGAESAVQLQQFCQQERVTLNTVLQTVLGLVLARYSSKTDICFGVMISGRNASLAGIEDMVGMLINALPFRLQIDNDQSVGEVLQHVQELHQADNKNGFSSLVDIQEQSELAQDEMLFETLLAVENYPRSDSEATADESYHIEQMWSQNATSFPLTIMVDPGETVDFYLLHDSNRIRPESIDRFWGHLSTLLAALISAPEQSVGQLEMLTQPELTQIQQWSAPETGSVSDCTLLDLFERQTAAMPDNIALIHKDKQLTYQQLDVQANRLAHCLLAMKLESGGQSLIAVALERSPLMVISVLAALKAGAAYVPVDPDYPAERIQRIMAGSGAGLLITHQRVADSLDFSEDIQTLIVEQLDLMDFSAEKPVVATQPDDLAYIIFTSGSTGLPKGVAINHRGAVNTILDINERFNVGRDDRVLALSSLSFDLSVYDIFGLLAAGSAVIILEHEKAKEPAHWAELTSLHHVTIWNSVPALMQVYTGQIEGNAAGRPESLRLVMMSGDWIPLNLPEHIRTVNPQAQIISLGGATEASIWSIWHPIDRVVDPSWKSIPYGKALRNQSFHVLDERLSPCPLLVPGHLYIGGIGLARCYWGDEEKTIASFITHPHTGERLYRTGDLGCWLPNGNIEFLGRDDFQVKIRGFRIELGEIEACLRQHPAVRSVVAKVWGSDGHQYLSAYVTADAVTPSLTEELKAMALAALPDYMVPSSYCLIDELPLTANGKLDRNALPEPKKNTEQEGRKPVSPDEELLAAVWTKLLNTEQVSRADSFFELGGNSLLAMQLVSRIRETFQTELPVRTVFEHPTLSGMAKVLAKSRDNITLPPIAKQPENEEMPLSFAQRRLWFLGQLEDSSNANYNIPLALRLSGHLHASALKQSLALILERHSTLRTCFTFQDGQPEINIAPTSQVEALQFHDLTCLPYDKKEEEVARRVNAYIIAPFDLTQDALFRAECLLVSENESVLLLNMHHIVSDGWSMVLFINEWQEAYTAFSQEKIPALPKLEIQYGDYAAWQKNWLQGAVLQEQIDYWKQQLAGIPDVIELPVDRPRTDDRKYHGDVYSCQLSDALSQK
ncbi:MAG: amino acid adenylation domain-containing protein, partial [Candidatus Electrothrix sp.]